MADMHKAAEPDNKEIQYEGTSKFLATQVLYLPEHHLKYKGHGFIK